LRGEKPDAIIAIGGGSVIDLAKGIAVLLSNPGRGIEYRGMHKVKNAAVPLIAYPTTAGTGTEVTWTASFTDEDEGKKLGINGNNVAPLCGVLAPELVASAPRSVALSSGLDTLVHAIEAVTARTATPITAAMGAQAFAMMFEALPRCLAPDAALAAWERAQLAAYIAGVAMMNAGGGPASGISYPLGVYYHVPHGFAGGIFLPGVFAFNVARGYHGYNCVYDLLPDADTRLGADRKAEEFVLVFREFYASVGGPEDLRPWGCTGDRAIEKLTELTITQRKENLDLNPVPFGRPDVAELLRPLCRG
jgi:alcohol dehydrogenase class IV